jgi:hypothetical protein
MFVCLFFIGAFVVLASASPQRRSATPDQQQTARNVSVIINASGFMPNVLRLDGNPGDKVRVSVTNRDKAPHGLRIKVANLEFGLDQPLAPGQSAEFEFTMPAKGGLGSFFSPVGQDRAKGFQGRAIIGGEAPGGAI